MKRYKPYVKAYAEGVVTLKEMKQVASVSFPVSLQMGMETAIFTVATVFVGWIGAEYLAAYQVILVMGTFGFMIYYSLGAATSILIANYSGLGDTNRVKHCASAGYHVILASALLASIAFLTIGEEVMRLSTSDEAVIGIALTLIVPWIVYQLGDATQIAYANALRGIKCVMPVMRYAFWAYIVVGIPACYIFAFPLNGGIVGVYLSFAVSLFVAGALFMWRFYKELRK
jgi:MATE family multidrug resistance protein